MKENYPIFVQWYKTLDWILNILEHYPRKVRFTLTTRISNEALNTLELIIEAIYSKDRVPIIDKINMSIEKQRIFFRLSFDRQYISLKQHKFISNELNTTGKMAGGWRKQYL